MRSWHEWSLVQGGTKVMFYLKDWMNMNEYFAFGIWLTRSSVVECLGCMIEPSWWNHWAVSHSNQGYTASVTGHGIAPHINTLPLASTIIS